MVKIEFNQNSLEEIFTIFSRIVPVLSDQMASRTYVNGISLAEYSPEEWYHFAKNYQVKLFQDHNETYISLVRNDIPLCYLNCSLKEDAVVEALTIIFKEVES